MTFDDVRSVNRPQYGGYWATSGCTCAHLTLPMKSLEGRVTFDDVTFGGHATSGNAQWYILYYYYSKKKAWEPFAHAYSILLVTWLASFLATSFPVTWFPVTILPVTSGSSTSNVTLSVPIYYWTLRLVIVTYKLTAEFILYSTKFMNCYRSEHCMLRPSLWFVTGQNAVCYD